MSDEAFGHVMFKGKPLVWADYAGAHLREPEYVLVDPKEVFDEMIEHSVRYWVERNAAVTQSRDGTITYHFKIPDALAHLPLRAFLVIPKGRRAKRALARGKRIASLRGYT